MNNALQTGQPYGLSSKTLNALWSVFCRYEKIDKVVLYGSRAKGTFRPSSDIDLTILGSELTLKDLNRIATALDDLLLPYEIDLSLHHQIDNQDLLEHIQRVGKEIYRR